MVNRTLWAGFGGLLLLIAVCGVAALTGFRQLQSREHRYRADAMQRAADLASIREAALLSGTLARDYLFWTDQRTVDGIRTRLDALQQETNRVLTRWDRDQPALCGEVRAYWKTLDVLFAVAGRERRRALDEYFYRELAKRREAMLSIADRTAQLQQLEREKEQQQLASFGARFVGVLSVAFLSTLLLGIAIAMTACRRIVRAEKSASQRKIDLEALSARLVKTQEDERKAVARELHDQVGQMLTALSMDCGQALHACDAARPLRPHLESIRSMSESLIVTVREISLSLRPSMLDDFGLVPALEWHAREVTRRSGIEIRLEATQQDCETISEPARTCIYRIAQEALRNCERHSAATLVELRLKRTGSFLQVTIRDNGKGFDTQSTRGLGLLGMQERVEALSGRYRIEAASGSGTCLTVEVPAELAVSLTASTEVTPMAAYS